MAGSSTATWGAPVRAYMGGNSDAFAAKVDSATGALIWNTFLGGDGADSGSGIAVDQAGNVYVAGSSYATWGAPVRAYIGGNGGNGDAFAAKLTSAGALTWNTFLGGTGADAGLGIAVDGGGFVYVAGFSGATWGAPVQAFFSDILHAFVAKLTPAGALTWNTFLGRAGGDQANSVVVDGGGFVYVAGSSEHTWGAPVRAFSGGNGGNGDAFAAKLTSAGALTWNTFLGGTGADLGYGIVVDDGGFVYVAGSSTATWGAPVRAYMGGNSDAFAAKLTSAGALTWNTFLGGTGYDAGYGIAVDDGGFVYVAGSSTATWGAPVLAFSGGNSDAFAAELNSDGALTWNTFLGTGRDLGYGIALASFSVYVAGSSGATWGAPVRAYMGGTDAFVVRMSRIFGVCGDGVLDPGEECDDGNTVSGDSCSSTCQLEIEEFCCDLGPATCDETSANDCALLGGQFHPGQPCDFATGSCVPLPLTPTPSRVHQPHAPHVQLTPAPSHVHQPHAPHQVQPSATSATPTPGASQVHQPHAPHEPHAPR